LETLNHNFQKVGACRAYVYSAFSFQCLWMNELIN
jgi:hypothetical protein